MRSNVASSMNVPCSIEVHPALMAAAAPLEACASSTAVAARAQPRSSPCSRASIGHLLPSFLPLQNAYDLFLAESSILHPWLPVAKA